MNYEVVKGENKISEANLGLTEHNWDSMDDEERASL